MKRLAFTLAATLAICFIAAPQAQAETNVAKKQAYIEAPLATTGIMPMAPALDMQSAKMVDLTRAISVTKATPQKGITGLSPAIIDTEQIAGFDAKTYALMTKNTRHAARLGNDGTYMRQLAGLTSFAKRGITLNSTPRYAIGTTVIAKPMEAGGNASGIQSATMNTNFTGELANTPINGA